jgi:hypothetical protein
MAVAAAGGRADRDEHRVRAGDGLVQVGAEGQPSRTRVVGDQLVEARLVDRHLALAQPSILAASLSTQTTSWPKSAKQAPDTSPT